MGTAITKITIVHGDEDPETIEDLLAEPSVRRDEGLAKLIGFLGGVAGGVKSAKITLSIDDGTNTTKASATIVCSQADAATDTVTIGGVDFVEGTDFVDGADDGECADNLAAAINASAELAGIVDASSDGVDTVTLTATAPGRWGNLITLSTDDAVAFTLSGAALSGATSAEEVPPRDWAFGVA